jgi:hypothetical protein
MTPVNFEIAVQSENTATRMQFCQPNKARVRQRHRDVAVGPHELFQNRMVLTTEKGVANKPLLIHPKSLDWPQRFGVEDRKLRPTQVHTCKMGRAACEIARASRCGEFPTE